MNGPTQIGIIGCGSVSTAYMRQIKELRDEGLVAVSAACDVTAKKRQVGEGYGATLVTHDHREVLASENVDVVLVLTPMPLHGPISKAALEAGKHVLVEKPMAVTLEEAAELVDISKNSPGFLLPAPHVVLSPTFGTIWQRIRNGDLGKVTLARARYGWSGPSWGEWFYKKGGGALFDLGVYNVATLTALLGPAKRVTAMTATAIPERLVDGKMTNVEIEDAAHVLIDFGDATFAVVTTGFTMQRSRGPSIEFYGTTGTLHLGGYDWAPDGYELWQNDVGAWQVYPEPNRSWPWTDGIRHLVECVRSGERPIITPEHGYHTLEIMIRAKEAGADGATRMIESSFEPPVFGEKTDASGAHREHDPGRR